MDFAFRILHSYTQEWLSKFLNSEIKVVPLCTYVTDIVCPSNLPSDFPLLALNHFIKNKKKANGVGQRKLEC
jgi:hypothetical protein